MSKTFKFIIILFTIYEIKRSNTIDNCGDYALYYLNSYGGWNGYLIKEKINKTKKEITHNIEIILRPILKVLSLVL